MDSAQIVVTVTGAVAAAATGWYFLASERGGFVAASAGVEQTARIVVRGGYSPNRIVVEKGRPVRLSFFRDEDESCSDTVVFGDLGISRRLPAHAETEIRFTPTLAGEFPFTCGMNMIRGTLVVVEPAAPRADEAGTP